MKTALITGASAGIGMELARVLAKAGHSLVLVARSEEKLSDLKSELEKNHKVKVDYLVKDLSEKNSCREVYEVIQQSKIEVDVLINNAGFGDFGDFSTANWEKLDKMIQLNVSALTQLTKLFLPQMIAHRYGRIMNVASVAAFQPGPFMAVYFATKAYVLSFSEALNGELKDSGVTVTALCPGPTESNFMEVSNMSESTLVKGRKFPSSLSVAEYGYRSMMNGKPVAIHGTGNYFLANLNRFVPRNWVVGIARKLMKKAD
jgi:short-subunit dehydrogenase